jgi:nicotinamidase-related amidase
MSDLTALLVIDVQESFRHRPYFRPDDLPSFFDRLNALCAGAAARGWPIVRVLHVEDEGAFAESSGWVTPMPEVEYTPALVVKKRFHSALAGTPLAAWLTARRIARVAVAGIRTEQCCETTTRAASDAGFAVDFVTDATLTFPMTHATSGRTYSPAEIRERTELVLDGRFATITTVADLLARGR